MITCFKNWSNKEKDMHKLQKNRKKNLEPKPAKDIKTSQMKNANNTIESKMKKELKCLQNKKKSFSVKSKKIEQKEN